MNMNCTECGAVVAIEANEVGPVTTYSVSCDSCKLSTTLSTVQTDEGPQRLKRLCEHDNEWDICKQCDDANFTPARLD